MITSKSKTLQLTFLDAGNKSVSYSIKDPKDDLDKGTVDAAVQVILEKNVFATDNSDLKSLKTSQIVTRQVESIDA